MDLFHKLLRFFGELLLLGCKRAGFAFQLPVHFGEAVGIIFFLTLELLQALLCIVKLCGAVLQGLLKLLVLFHEIDQQLHKLRTFQLL